MTARTRRTSLAAPKTRWITWRPAGSWAAGPEPRPRPHPNTRHDRADSGVGRHLSTTRRGLPADACLAPASAPPDAGHRELPHGRAGGRRRMVRPLPKYAHRVSLLPQPALSQVPGLGARALDPAAPRRTAAGGVF